MNRRAVIDSWRFDDGKPYWMEPLKRWSTPRQPCWTCVLWLRGLRSDGSDEVLAWLADNGRDGWDYDTTARFNGGNPFTTIRIFDTSMATAFRMRYYQEMESA